MKRPFTFLFLLFGIVVNTINIYAQEEQSMDSIECLKNYSLYKESLKKKMYDYSINPWREMFNLCPDVTIRLYSDGVDIYKHYIQLEKDEVRRQALIDTLMIIYDQRIKYFGTHPKYPEGWILGRKGIDMVKYRRADLASLKEAAGYFTHSFDKIGLRMEPMVAVNWLQATNALLQEGHASLQELLEVYLNVDDVLTEHISKQKSPERIEMLNKASTTCVEIVSQSGFTDCIKLQEVLTAKYDMLKDNIEGLERILALMDAFDCTQSPLYAKVAEQNYTLNPSAKASYLLAKYFIKKNAFDKAKEYYLKTISQGDEELQAKCFYELAVVTFSHYKNSLEARKYARNALQIKNDWGNPYILIGNIYAHESRKYGDNDFEHQTVYWVAIDQFKKAKAVDPACAPEADKQINLYSQYLPDKETGFFHGIQEGENYTVGSWINEKTIVRYR